MTKNGMVKWIAGALVTVLCVVLAALFCSWQAKATECSDDLEAMQQVESGRWAAHHEVDKRVTAVETNMANIDETLARMDGRLAAIEKAVR